MNKNAKIGIVVGVVLLLLVLLYYFGGKRNETFVSDHWFETYRPEEKGPYGTYILKELLDTAGLFGNFIELDKKLEEALEDAPKVNDIYFFVGRENFITDSAAKFLYEFINKGNTVFMSCDVFPVNFLDYITYDGYALSEDLFTYDSIQYFKFSHPQLSAKRYECKSIYQNKLSQRTWKYFDPYPFDFYGEDTLIELGMNTKDEVNFLKIKFGKGLIYLHSTPYQFTNISLMKRDGFAYAEKVLEHIPPGRVQWDRYNLQSHSSGNSDGGDGTGGDEKRESIFQFILDHPPLAWCLFLLIAGALLYAIFKGKRKQKIIPAVESKDNTSMEYINTLSSLYLQENKHQKLIKLKERTFINFIAEHYYISTKTPDDIYFEKIAVKSQVDKSKIAEIFKTFHVLEKSPGVSDEELILLHQKIEYFYKKCR